MKTPYRILSKSLQWSALLFIVLSGHWTLALAQEPSAKPRVIVTTDGEVDD